MARKDIELYNAKHQLQAPTTIHRKWIQTSLERATLFLNGQPQVFIYKSIGRWWHFDGVVYFTQRAAMQAADQYVLDNLHPIDTQIQHVKNLLQEVLLAAPKKV
jgi:hypothetical protein